MGSHYKAQSLEELHLIITKEWDFFLTLLWPGTYLTRIA